MISPSVGRPTLGLAALVMLGGVSGATAQSYGPGDDVDQPYPAQAAFVAAGRVDTVASRCADFGPGFIDMGGGVCGRVGGSRVQLGTHSANAGAWTSAGTTSATLRSDGMLPGARVQHLRVRSGLDQ